MGVTVRALAITATLALATAPGVASGAPIDVSSTHAYIQANYALARASQAKIGVAQANIAKLNRRLAQACPYVGAGSPENEASQPLSYEVAVALWSVSYSADAGPIDTFMRAVRRLRWNDHRIARIAHSYAADLHELATLPLPDLCGDVRAWKTSGFQTIPAETTSIDRGAEALEPKTISPRLLAPYERPADRSVLARTKRLETKIEQFEVGTGFDDWDMVLATLGLNQ